MMIFISHSGVAYNNNPPGRGSGRYPFGSGDRPFQHGGKSLVMDNMGEYKISKYKDPNAFDVKDFLKSLALTASYVGGYIGTVVTWNPVFMLPAVAITIPLAIRSDIKRKAFFGDEGKSYKDVEGEAEKVKNLPKKKEKTTAEQDVLEVNPRKNEYTPGKCKNCTDCTLAMEMRRRGYDVIARSSSKGRTASQMLAMTKNGKLEHVKFEQGSKENRKQFVNRSYNELLNKLESKGEGARGYLGIKYESMWSGHALFWEVSNGKAIIYDPQAGAYGVKVDSTMSIADYNYGFEIIRFDNVKLKPEITEACRSNPKRRS